MYPASLFVRCFFCVGLLLCHYSSAEDSSGFSEAAQDEAAERKAAIRIQSFMGHSSTRFTGKKVLSQSGPRRVQFHFFAIRVVKNVSYSCGVIAVTQEAEVMSLAIATGMGWSNPVDVTQANTFEDFVRPCRKSPVSTLRTEQRPDYLPTLAGASLIATGAAVFGGE